MVGKVLVHRRPMDFLVHSSEVAYFPSEAVEVAVYFPCEVAVVRQSPEAVDRSVEVVDHNYRMFDILPRV